VNVADPVDCAATSGKNVKLMSTVKAINRATALIVNPFLVIFINPFQARIRVCDDPLDSYNCSNYEASSLIVIILFHFFIGECAIETLFDRFIYLILPPPSK
jgi:hypothetical protein